MKNYIKFIKKYWNEHKYRIIILVSFSIISTFILVYWPIILKNIIDTISQNLEKTNILKNLIFFILLSFGFVFFYTSIQTNRIFINRSFFFKMTLDLIIFLLKQSKKFFNKYKTGDIITRFVDDLQKLSWFSCSGIFRFFDASSIILFSLFIMFSLSYKITLIAIIPFIFIFIVVILLEKKIDIAFEQLQASISDVNDNIEKAFSSIKIIKSCNMEEFSCKEFETLMNKRKNKEMKIVYLDALWHGSNMFLINIGYFLIMFIGGKFVMKDNISIGTFIAFTQYYYIILEHFYSIIYFFVELKRNIISAKRVTELYDNEDIIKYDKLYYENSEELIRIKDIQKIELKNVNLKFNERVIFNNLNLEINKGDFVGITGKVGSGKTLLCDIIIGNEEPSSGEIYINGIPLENINIKSYRAKIGYIFQEPLLFSESIEENIIFDKSNLISEDILFNWKELQKIFYQDYNKRRFFYIFKDMSKNIIIVEDNKEDLNLELDNSILNNGDKNNNLLDKLEDVNNKNGNNNKLDIIDKINDENLINSIYFANLNDDINMFPDNIKTKVGSKGIMVSGGQRERITIARAIYKKPSIFIFDDSTRSLDAKTERKVLQNIKELSKSNTIIMVTHRLESLNEADKIIEL